MNQKRRGYKDAEAQRIIRRAAELDAEGATDPLRLREIAEEAGISAAAIDQALREHDASQASAPIEDASASVPWRRLVAAIGAAIVAALVAALAFGGKPPL